MWADPEYRRKAIEGCRKSWTKERRLAASKRSVGNTNSLGIRHTKEEQDKRALECGAKPFLIYKTNGEFVGEFVNVKRFCRENNVERKSIWAVLSGKYKCASAFFAFYKKDFKIEKLEAVLKTHRNKNMPFTVHTVKGEYIGEWTSQKACTEALGIGRNNICSCLKGKRKTCKGFVFKYK